MNGTDLAYGEVGDVPDHLGCPAPLVSVRLGEIRAFSIVDDEDEPVLVVSDGETTVEFACGLSGLSGPAARGAQRLADAVRDYASTLESKIAP
jgi:hypothetical protein